MTHTNKPRITRPRTARLAKLMLAASLGAASVGVAATTSGATPFFPRPLVAAGTLFVEVGYLGSPGAGCHYAWQIEAAITPKTKMVWVESPTNPMLKLVDLAAVSAVARKKGLLAVCDNTFMTPYFQRPW